MVKYILTIMAVLTLGLQSCSWMEYFTVMNTTAADCVITYELQKDVKGFPIFEDKPSCYELTRGGRINWDVKVDFVDANPDPLVVTVTLPTKCVLVFGHLSNDEYKQYNQEFINDRKFNLTKLSIESSGATVQITPAIFDAHFTKEKGTIQYKVK